MKPVFAVFPRTQAGFSTTKYEYSPRSGWKAVQRLCFWLLGRIGAFSHEAISVQSITLDAKRLSAALISNHLTEVHRLMSTPARIVLGAEDWHDLMGDPNIQSAVRFQAPVDLRKPGHESLLGVDVTIIPWMRGLVILPKETEK